MRESRLPARVERRRIDGLRPGARNARVRDKADDAKIEASLREFGWTRPLLISPDGEIVAGERVWRVARAMGFAEVPVVELDWLTSAQIEAYRIADNRLAEDGRWDEKTLTEILADLAGDGFDLPVTGFDAREIDRLLASLAPPAEPPPAEPAVEPLTRLGDLWLLGEHRLLCGDSTKAETFATLLARERPHAIVSDAAALETADAVFTDPPYGMSYKGRTHGGIAGDDARGGELVALIAAALGHAKIHAREDAAFYVCLTWRTYGEFLAALAGLGLAPDACLVWDKEWIGPGTLHYRPRHEFVFYRAGKTWRGGKGESDVWQLRRDAAADYVHPTQKPLGLVERALRNSTAKGDVVLDVFGGSGSTLLAAERLGRRARLIELDPRWCDAIVGRWETETGRKAERI